MPRRVRQVLRLITILRRSPRAVHSQCCGSTAASRSTSLARTHDARQTSEIKHFHARSNMKETSACGSSQRQHDPQPGAHSERNGRWALRLARAIRSINCLGRPSCVWPACLPAQTYRLCPEWLLQHHRHDLLSALASAQFTRSFAMSAHLTQPLFVYF